MEQPQMNDALRLLPMTLLASCLTLACAACTVGGAPAGGAGDAQAAGDAATTGDAGGGVFDKKNAKFTLEILLNAEGVTILGTEVYDPMYEGLKSVASNESDSLKWVIKADDGKILGKGYVPDPRIVISETGDGQRYREDSAMFKLDVPTDEGTLNLYENNPTF